MPETAESDGGRAGLIDVHSHFVTEEYVAQAVAGGHEHPDGMPSWPQWSEDDHLGLMDECGIERSFLSVSSPGTHFGDDARARQLARKVNDFGAELARRRPDRFGHFAALSLPDVPGSLAEAERALDELGSGGIALESNAAGMYLGDDRLRDLWSLLNERSAVVFVHPTSPPDYAAVSLGRPRPMLEFLFDSARTVSDMIFAGTVQAYPGIKWIITHGGGVLPLAADRIELFRTQFLGAAGAPSAQETVASFWFDLAGTPFPHQVPAAVAAFGDQRLLYGSDFCWTPRAATVQQVHSIDEAPQPSGDTWRTLTTRNARRLFETKET